MIIKLLQISTFFLFISYVFAKKEVNFDINSDIVNKITEKVADKTAEKIVKKVVNIISDNNFLDKGKFKKNSKDITKDLLKVNPDTKILRIGSGSLGGNYFVLGELVGGVISHPKNSLACGSGGTCGVNNLISQNITSVGSLSNISNLKKGINETCFVQSDIAYWSYTGTGPYKNKEKFNNLRAIASLYPEALHIIVRKDSNINTISDMVDKRVSLGSSKSGTLYGARLILGAYKIREDDINAKYLNNSDGISKLLSGELDAMFFTVGAPAPILQQLFNNSKDYKLLSIDNSKRRKILRSTHYFLPYTIVKNTYKNSFNIDTISVYALWVTTKKMDNGLIYKLTKSIWNKNAKQLYKSSKIGHYINIENSLKGIGIPLHKGAKKYYNEIGKRF